MTFDKNVRAFLKELAGFDYQLSSIDHVWKLLFPDARERWHHVHVTLYKETFYVSLISGEAPGLEVPPQGPVKEMDSFGSSWNRGFHDDPSHAWTPLIESARAWLKVVRADWVKANRRVVTGYPLKYRTGIVPHAVLRTLLPKFFRLDKELGRQQCKEFISLVEGGYFHRDEYTIRPTMTAHDFFEYCRIAYIASKREEDHLDETKTGRQMYERHADGRHEGLLDIDENSPQEFAEWIDHKHPKRTTGGHPWEIKRGGNTTHISLYVSRPSYRQEGFKLDLVGDARTRLVETIQMFLAIHQASLPISISNPEGIRRRLLAQDNIGIVPSYDSLHRANQHYPEDQHVHDVMYLDDLGRHKRGITPFVSWEPLPVLKPRDR